MNLKEASDIVSSGIGHNIATQISQDPTLNKDLVLQAITDVFAGKGQAPDQEKFQEAAKLVQAEATKELRAAGDDFLAKNKSEDGVQVTESGLQYKVLKEGEGGDKPKATDQVTVHYTGTLVDGKVFDSSVERGQPAQFGVGQVIPGWVEGLQLMEVGSKYQFFIPQDLAYGERGSQGAIPPFAALIFEVELIAID